MSYRRVKKSNFYVLRMLIDPTLRPPHGQQPGQDVNEDTTDPGSHSMGLWRPKVHIEHDHRHADTILYNSWSIKSKYWGQELLLPDRYQDHGENQVFAQ